MTTEVRVKGSLPGGGLVMVLTDDGWKPVVAEISPGGTVTFHLEYVEDDAQNQVLA